MPLQNQQSLKNKVDLNKRDRTGHCSDGQKGQGIIVRVSVCTVFFLDTGMHTGSGYEAMTLVFLCTLSVYFRKVGLLSTLWKSIHRAPCSSHWVTIDWMKVQAQTLKKLRWIRARWVGNHSKLVPSSDRFNIHKCHYPPILPPWWRESGRSRRCRWWQSQRYGWEHSRSLLN